MDNDLFQIFDAYQLSGYGGLVEEGEGLSYRYYTSKKLFWTNMYIPYGPVCSDASGFKNFVNKLSNRRLTKIHIDLPVIFNPELEKECVGLLRAAGYKTSEYILDNETLLVTQESYSLNSRNMRYVRRGMKSFDVRVVERFTDDELQQVDMLLALASRQLGYKQKPFAAVEEVVKNGLSSVAYSHETGKIEGVLIGYTATLDLGPDKPTNILQLMFTALSDAGRNEKLGFALHHELFNFAFDKAGYDIIDFHGASRTQGRSYVEFKKMFGGTFKANAGSFTRIQL
jgi:hypothetical protein